MWYSHDYLGDDYQDNGQQEEQKNFTLWRHFTYEATNIMTTLRTCVSHALLHIGGKNEYNYYSSPLCADISQYTHYKPPDNLRISSMNVHKSHENFLATDAKIQTYEGCSVLARLRHDVIVVRVKNCHDFSKYSPSAITHLFHRSSSLAIPS